MSSKITGANLTMLMCFDVGFVDEEALILYVYLPSGDDDEGSVLTVCTLFQSYMTYTESQ